MPTLRLPGDSKPTSQSKTVWANVIIAVGTCLVALIDTDLIQDNPGWVAAIVVVVNVLNILLRLVTDKPVTLGVLLLAVSLAIAPAAIAAPPDVQIPVPGLANVAQRRGTNSIGFSESSEAKAARELELIRKVLEKLVGNAEQQDTDIKRLDGEVEKLKARIDGLELFEAENGETPAAVAAEPVAPAPNTMAAKFAAEVMGKTPTMAEYMHGVAMKHRTANGRGEQRLDDDCTRIAQNWANWMAANNTMRHGGGENIIAYGTTTPEATMQMWIKSPGHRAFVLGNSTRAGWGCQRSSNGTWYWAGCFRNDPPLSKANVASAPAR